MSGRKGPAVFCAHQTKDIALAGGGGSHLVQEVKASLLTVTNKFNRCSPPLARWCASTHLES